MGASYANSVPHVSTETVFPAEPSLQAHIIDFYLAFQKSGEFCGFFLAVV